MPRRRSVDVPRWSTAVPGSRCEPHPPRRRCFGLLRSARILWGHRPRIPRDPPPTWRQADRELPGPCRDLAASGPHASVSSPLSAPARSCAATATPGRAPPSTGARAMPRPASCAAKSAGPVGLLRRDLVLRRAPPSRPARPGRRLLRLTRPVPYGASLGPLGHFCARRAGRSVDRRVAMGNLARAKDL